MVLSAATRRFFFTEFVRDYSVRIIFSQDLDPSYVLGTVAKPRDGYLASVDVVLNIRTLSNVPGL